MSAHLTTGGADDPFLPKLLHAIRRATEIDLAVAFIKSSGLDLIFDALAEAVTYRGARLRLLTSDYLDVTDPAALRKILLLGDEGADARVFEAQDYSFHLKVYIFIQVEGREIVEGEAYVGSSNISRIALTDGLEWNYRICHRPDAGAQGVERLQELRREFAALFADRRAVPLTHAWIEAYEQRWTIRRLPVAPGADDPEPLPPAPNEIQGQALEALANSRTAGYQRGLVVLATGLGKTYLAAFDTERFGARRVLFLAHRDEILLQAEATFQRVRPKARVGQYTGTRRDDGVDLLFASVQTLGQKRHLEDFAPRHFDYIVVDEFHHAAAATYRQLLQHFQPRFLLGLTATPERTDQSDILSLCDDNLVYTCNLFDGVSAGLLCPFTYHGILDEHVNYQAIPWRNGRFDPESLSNKLATLARARHALREWRAKGQAKTLAFCVSRRHADFMVEQFRRADIRTTAVYSGAQLTRSEALERLTAGELDVVFSVDLFNEGIDLPAIDTVMMLRPTDSKVLFLQQLGRGLRQHPGKERLVVLDFIGNHRSFLNKPQALFQTGDTYRELASFARRLERNELALPAGCFVNYDLAIINFLKSLVGDDSDPASDYEALKASLGRRPTLVELYRAGVSPTRLRKRYGHWWAFVREQDDLEDGETRCLEAHGGFLHKVETRPMTRSFTMIVLQVLLNSDGFRHPPRLAELAEQSRSVLLRRPILQEDLASSVRDLGSAPIDTWQQYWRRNPIKAWLGENLKDPAKAWFRLDGERFRPVFSISEEDIGAFHEMVQQLVDQRLAAYQSKNSLAHDESEPQQDANVVLLHDNTGIELPFFPSLRVACGHFRAGRGDAEEYRMLGPSHGRLDPARHFIARASGDSMNGGKNPIQDGDYLLLERIDPDRAGSNTGGAVVIERQDASGDDQYLLRVVTKAADGRNVLKATNPDYDDMEADENMRPLARLRAVLDPREFVVG